MKMTQFANFANNATKQILGTSGLICENLQSMFSYPDAIDTLHPVMVSGDMIAIKDGASGSAKNVTVYIEPLQIGNGTPSPDNVRSINGWTGVRISRLGSNLADISKFVGITNVIVTFPENGKCHIVTNAQTTYRAANIRATDMTYPKGTYYIKFKVKANPIRNDYTCIALRTVVGNTLGGNSIQITDSNIDKSYEGLFVANSDCYLSYIGNGNTTGEEYNTDITIYDLTVSKLNVPYENYTRATYNIIFPSASGTVYNGTLNVTNGILTLDKAYVEFDGSDDETIYSEIEGQRAKISRGAPGIKAMSGRIPVLCNIGVTKSGNNPNTVFATSDGSVYYYFPTSPTTVEQFRTFLSNTHMQVIYPLNEPQIYQINPTNILLLEGNNTVYADCGSMQLEYYRREGRGEPNE